MASSTSCAESYASDARTPWRVLSRDERTARPRGGEPRHRVLCRRQRRSVRAAHGWRMSVWVSPSPRAHAAAELVRRRMDAAFAAIVRAGPPSSLHITLRSSFLTPSCAAFMPVSLRSPAAAAVTAVSRDAHRSHSSLRATSLLTASSRAPPRRRDPARRAVCDLHGHEGLRAGLQLGPRLRNHDEFVACQTSRRLGLQLGLGEKRGAPHLALSARSRQNTR